LIPNKEQALASINQVNGVKIVSSDNDRIIIYADLKNVPTLAAIPYVKEVNPHKPLGLFNNVAAQILNLDKIHNPSNLDGKGQIIAIADTGLDTGINDVNMCADFRGRITNIFSLGRPGDASDTQGHGTHVAGSVLGNGSNSNGKICGMAPQAKLVFQSLLDPARGLGGIPGDLGVTLFDIARNNGASVHSNSWGAQNAGDGTYDGQCR
jgi:subtilisin family serine protease